MSIDTSGMGIAPSPGMTGIRRIALLFCCFASVAGAQELTPPDALRRAAEAHIESRLATSGRGEAVKLHVTAAPVDPRLRLQRCGAPLEAFLPTGAEPAARTTVGVRCPSPQWTVYVPVTIESTVPVLVLKQAGARLAALTAADVERQTRRVPGFPSTYVTDVTELAERHLRRAVPPGTPLTVDMFAADIKVRRGQRVTLVSAVGGIEVLAAGEAIADANPDGRVRVRNLGSRKVVEGRVESADRVRVGI